MTRLLGSSFVLVFFALFLGGSTCGGSGGTPPPDDCFCAEIYDPVCGTDGATYDNPCSADCLGVPVAYPGTCDSGSACATMLCGPGTVCVEVEVQCVTTPCNPVAQCVPVEQACGNTVCQGEETCCNASCGVCAPPGVFCTQEACEPVDTE